MQHFNGLVHKNLNNLNLHAWLLEPLPSRNKGSLAKWQQELRLLKDAQPEPFINQSGPFLSNGVTQNKVDFRSPSVNQIADFLLHLFKERNLQPSTIDGYRTAIADMVGNDKLNISKDENLTCLLDSFHRDKPKGGEYCPGTFRWYSIS